MAFILFDENPGSVHPVDEVRLDKPDLTVRGPIRARIELELERVDLDETGAGDLSLPHAAAGRLNHVRPDGSRLRGHKRAGAFASPRWGAPGGYLAASSRR